MSNENIILIKVITNKFNIKHLYFMSSLTSTYKFFSQPFKI